MRFVFIINPQAGKQDISEKMSNSIHEYFKKKNIEYKIYITEYRLHTSELAKLEANKGDKLRIYVCGGDGSLSELVDGVSGCENVEIGVFPYGSGNDFIRSFESDIDFFDIDKQIKSKSKTIDTIKTNNKTSINICSLGFDAGVGYNMTKFKNLPLISGSMAYNLAVVKMLFTNLGANMKVKIHSNSGVKEYKDNYLFVVGANGVCYGGGYYAAPNAVLDDNLLEFVLIKTPSLLNFMKLVNLYKKGLHMSNKKFDKYLTYIRGTKIEIECEKEVYCNFDGECSMVKSDVMQLGEHKVRFIVPR